MNEKNHMQVRYRGNFTGCRVWQLVLAVLVLTVGAPGLRADVAKELQGLWHDPTFQKQFVGGYGINAEIEPRVTPEEVQVLEKVRPLMADNMPKAKAILEKQVKGECSAIMDITLGNIYFQEDKTDQALECYTKAVAKFPSFRARGASSAWFTSGWANVMKRSMPSPA